MTAPAFAAQLAPQTLDLDDILLDPNNPRLLGVDGYEGVTESRVAEPGVQRATLRRLNTGGFDMESLRASIARSGLLQVDRIVVRPIDGQKFVVVEGNRRIAACKTLLESHKAGERDLPQTVVESLERPEVLVLGEVDAHTARLDQWVIQGIRHISGIRPWGAYQSARTIEAMLKGLGYTEDDVVDALSITKSRVRRSMKVLSALAQMEEDDDFADSAGSELYAFFDEVLKRPKVRTWLGWSDQSKRFEELENLSRFYTWISPDDLLPESRRRIAVAESIRNLDAVVADSAAIAVLDTPGRTIDDALAVVGPGAEAEWREPIRRAIKALDGLPMNVLEGLDEDDEALINQLLQLTQRRLEVAHQLRGV